MADERYSFTVLVEHLTDKAILIKDGGNDIWLPLSQIETNDELITGELSEITIPEWLAIKKELI